MALQTATDYIIVGELFDLAVKTHAAISDAEGKEARELRQERAAICAELRRCGIGTYRIARVLGVSATAVQQWTNGVFDVSN